MPARLKIDDIARLVGRTVFFDTNFFIDLFWPTGRNARADESARLFNACLKRSIRPAVDFTVISEAINRILRIEYTKHLQTTGRDSERFSFKQYRDSPEGKDAQADIYQVIKKQLPSFSVYGKVFTFSDIQSFLEVDALDFNDKAIAALCIENDFVLATADRDYASVLVDIVSSNRAIVG